MTHGALMFEFPDEASARQACGTLDELGYEPQLHGGGVLHIHVEREDLTSALEIAQSHGGRLVSEQAAADGALTASAYALDALTIPAHTVNEDWEPAYFGGEPEAPQAGIDRPAAQPADAADDGSYNRFEAY
ncbi:hypothetical protein [Cohnella sp. 56]|uniref:hypothetical protein n=1 Tax=Cohnella sp. 56 TaxID=3113722 RepID=UPI0030E83351